MESLDAGLRQLLQLLGEQKVRFVLVGGLAIGAWGHVRATKDIDIVPDPDPDNLARLGRLLEDYGGKVRVGERLLAGDSVSVFLRSGDIVIVTTDLGQIDILQGVPHIPRYEEMVRESELAVVDGMEVRVCSLRHLVAMKLAAGRPEDVKDLEALKIAQPEFDWAEGSSGVPGSGEPGSGGPER